MSSKKRIELGLMAQEALDTEVTRIAQQKPPQHDYDPACPYVADDLLRFVIRVLGGEIRMESRLEFLPTLQWINSKRRSP